MTRILIICFISITTLTFISCKDKVTNGGITSCDFPSFTGVADSCIIGIPNMFTPNGDGVNDAFVVIFINNGISEIEDLHIVVQNEGAMTVAEGFSTTFQWDGEASGAINNGVFTVTVNLTIDAQPYTFESYVYCLPYSTGDFDPIDCSDCRFLSQWDGDDFNTDWDSAEDVCD